MLTAHSGLPLYIGQTNENAAQTGTNQQRPYDVNPSVSLYTGGSSQRNRRSISVAGQRGQLPARALRTFVYRIGSVTDPGVTGRHRQLG